MKYLLLLSFLLAPTTFAEPPLRVAIVDTGLNLQDYRFKGKLCKEGHKDFTGEGLDDTHGHGTHVASLILKNTKNVNYCLIIVKYTKSHESSPVKFYEKAMSYVEFLHPDIVNMSLTGKSFIEEEYSAIHNLPNSIFIVAAGNEDLDANNELRYPAALTKSNNNVIVVGSLDKNGSKAPLSNYGYDNMKWEIGDKVIGYAIKEGNQVMSGTSQAAALYTAHYLNENFSK